MNLLWSLDGAVLVVAVVALVAAGWLVLRHRRRTGGDRLRRHPTLLAVQGGLVGGVLAATATGVLVLTFNSAHPEWLGLPLAVAPGLAVSVGLAVVALTPALRTASVGTRAASLERRGAWTVGSRQAYVLPVVAAAVLAAVLVATSVTASVDEGGLARAFSLVGVDGGSTATPYPGWYYAGPVLAVTALLLGTATLAMRRVATLPALQSEDEQADRAWRRAATSTISFLTTAGLLAYLAGTVLFAGSAIRSAGDGTALSGLGGALTAAALLITALAWTCSGLAIAGAVAFRSAALPAPEPLSP